MFPYKAQNSDIVCRYLYNSNDFSSNGVRHSAFIPPQKHPNEISVCVRTNLSEEDTWEKAPPRKDKTLKGRADLEVLDIRNSLSFLEVEVDGKPHKYHANILNFPTEKNQRRIVAAKLAEISCLVKKPQE